MDRIECSIWDSGRRGWGLKVPGGPEVRSLNFNRSLGCIALVLDGSEVWINIDKKSFWSTESAELLNQGLAEYIARHNLQPSGRVWLNVIEPGARFEVELV